MHVRTSRADAPAFRQDLEGGHMITLDQLIEALGQERERIGSGSGDVYARRTDGGVPMMKVKGLDTSDANAACIFVTSGG